MPAQQLLLSWKDHNGALVSVFENLLKKNSLVDCTLAAEGQYLKAHKVVLSACSAYFELLFNQESEKNPIVILKDVKFVELEAAVNFMYRGEVEVCEDRLGAFLEVADALQIKGLGSDGRFQTTKNKTETIAKTTKLSGSTQQFSRKGAHSPSENTGESVNTAEVDLTSNNESSSRNHQSHRDTSNSSPSLAIGSSFSMASTSGSGRPGSRGNLDSSSPSSRFPSGETVPTDINTVIKTEPVTDPYLEEKSDETERDFDDVTMMEDQEDWDEPNPESMGDDQVMSAEEHGYTDPTMKTEHSASENVAAAQAADLPTSDDGSWVEPGHQVFVKEEPGPSHWTPPSIDLCSESRLSTPGTDDGAASRTVNHQQAGDVPPQPYFCLPSREDTRTPSHVIGPDMRRRPLSETIQGVTMKFSCQWCHKRFRRKFALDVHMRIHTGRKPHKCLECECAFTNKASLRLHRRVHTGETPFKCHICSYASADRSNLLRHFRSHTGGKCFACHHCPEWYSSLTSLRRHEKLVHQIMSLNSVAEAHFNV